MDNNFCEICGQFDDNHTIKCDNKKATKQQSFNKTQYDPEPNEKMNDQYTSCNQCERQVRKHILNCPYCHALWPTDLCSCGGRITEATETKGNINTIAADLFGTTTIQAQNTKFFICSSCGERWSPNKNSNIFATVIFMLIIFVAVIGTGILAIKIINQIGNNYQTEFQQKQIDIKPAQ